MIETVEMEVRDLSFQYVRSRVIFRDVGFTLREGDIFSVLGANGAGKSTLLYCLAGLMRPCGGKILLEGRDISELSRNEMARSVGYVPQIHSAGFAYSVLDYVVMGRAPYIPQYGSPSKRDYAIARRQMEQVGLGGMERRILTELSGGEQQLAMIARVLTQEARVILLDEPTNHLDYGNQYRTIELMRGLAERGYMLVVTTHNPDHVLKLSGKVGILEPGGTMWVGRAEEELTAERLSRLYRIGVAVSYMEDAGRMICYVTEGGRLPRGNGGDGGV